MATSGEAERLADLLEEFAHRELTLEQKLELVRQAPAWNPLIEPTSPEWLRRRLQSVVDLFTINVRHAVTEGDLTDSSVTADERSAVLDELRTLASRLGGDEDADINSFLNAEPDSVLGKALRQYEAHVAYYAATRLLLVRIWEDLGLLKEILRDGGFDEWMGKYDDIVTDVVRHSFDRASQRYRSLFVGHRSYDWYTPGHEAYAEVIYQLANTYLGAIESDVLGQVYEQLLERIDRKLLGQYYTPRDIIGLIWDLIGFDTVAGNAEAEGRLPRVLDIAVGSGGFLVDACSRLRRRLSAAQDAGASLGTQAWLNGVAENLLGIEIQRFSAYLAELNLLVQLGHVVAKGSSLRVPSLGIVLGDTLAMHDPIESDPFAGQDCARSGLISDEGNALDLAHKIVNANVEGPLMDVACGNPPYIGQKVAAKLIERTRRWHPYWEQFVGHHMDYLYWFLILGISKLRPEGRFGFVTTEYWLRAIGAKPLRRYLAENCQIDRIVLL